MNGFSRVKIAVKLAEEGFVTKAHSNIGSEDPSDLDLEAVQEQLAAKSPRSECRGQGGQCGRFS